METGGQLIRNLRNEYKTRALLENEVQNDPVRQFDQWFREALKAEVHEPNAMTLATAGKNGQPSARIVLLKGYDPKGFVFYTNYNSRKSLQLQENPLAAMIFFWPELERQVRIEGRTEKIEAELSEQYFNSRPLGNRLGAWVSPQSEVIPDRTYLENRLQEYMERYPDEKVPRPEHWGGYRLYPELIEFWQGRPNRLHDRLCFTKKEDSWSMSRLAP